MTKRSLLLLGGAVMAAFALPPAGVAGGSDTIGSLPSADGGDGSQTFFLNGPRQLVYDSIADAGGDGFYVVVDLPGDLIWIEFYGDVCLKLDAEILKAHPEVEMGLTAGFEGGGMVVLPEIGGLPSGRTIFVDVGMSMATPFARIKTLVQEGLVLHTAQAVARHRAQIRYELSAGYLYVCQDHR